MRWLGGNSNPVSDSPLHTHFKHYASANMLSMLVGFATFPLLARNLDISEYGLLGLITTSATLLVAFGKLGLQHSILRFYPLAQSGSDGMDLDSLHTTAYLLFAGMTFFTLVVWMVSGWFVVPMWLSNPQIPAYFTILAIFVIARMAGSVTGSMLRSLEYSKSLGRSVMAGRVMYLILLYAMGLVYGFSIAFVLVVTVLAECFAVYLCFWAYRDHARLQLSSFRFSLAGNLLLFGLPLMMMEAVGLLMRLIDRYMIGSFLGEFELGQFAASSSLIVYADLIIIGTVAAAVKPRYNKLWVRAGRDSTIEFLRKGAEIYLLLGIPFTGLFILMAPDLLVVLAGSRYLEGTQILPYFAFIVLIDGLLIFLLAGLHLTNNTRMFVIWGVIAAALNLIGNYILIPLYELQGAAAATLIAHLVLAGGLLAAAARRMQIKISNRYIPMILLCTVPVVAVLMLLPLQPGLLSGMVKFCLAVPILIGIPLMLSTTARHWVFGLRWRLRPGRAV